MDATKKSALEARGWRFGDAADFLEMSDEERQLLDARVEVALAVRRQRTARKLTQKQLANRIQTSQSRIAKIERAASDVSLDQILRAFTAGGGRVIVRHIDPPHDFSIRRRPGTGPKKKKRAALEGTALQIDLIERKAARRLARKA